MKLTSTAFSDNSPIPRLYTCDGDNVSPALDISEVPENTKSLALISDDPDAPKGTWVHWVVWNIPPETTRIGEGAQVGVSGITDFGRVGYGGPCPPSGVHRYFFKIYALDTMLDMSENETKADLQRAMKGHILDFAELVGLYERAK